MNVRPGYSRELDQAEDTRNWRAFDPDRPHFNGNRIQTACHKPEKVITNNVCIASSGSYPRGTGWYSSLTPNA